MQNETLYLSGRKITHSGQLNRAELHISVGKVATKGKIDKSFSDTMQRQSGAKLITEKVKKGMWSKRGIILCNLPNNGLLKVADLSTIIQDNPLRSRNPCADKNTDAVSWLAKILLSFFASYTTLSHRRFPGFLFSKRMALLVTKATDLNHGVVCRRNG